jgi:hypothetical protein
MVFVKLILGLCLWSTGITSIPLVQDLIKQIPEQNNKVCIVTDEFLKVKGMYLLLTI